MIVSQFKYEISIGALVDNRRQYVVQVEQLGKRTKTYAVGENNSVSNLVARLCNELEVDTAARRQEQERC